MAKKLTYKDINNLDDWIEKLYKGEIISEMEVKQLCDKVL
jgi:hypothetical protein